jgi:ribonuclease D
VRAIQRGLHSPDKPQLIKATHYRQSAEEKKRYHELEKKRNRRAHDLGIDATIIASRAELVQLARNGTSEEDEIVMMNWQNELLA